MYSFEKIRACFHANTSAEMITPAITAIAKSAKTVMMVTVTITNTSDFGICLRCEKLDHSKVPTLTINIIPTKTPTGIALRTSVMETTKTRSPTAAVKEERRPRPPEVKLMIL